MPPTKYDSTVMLIDEDVKGKDVAIKEDVDSLGGSTGGDKSASPAPNSRKKLWIGLGVTAGVLALAGIAAGIAVGVTNSKNASAASSTTPGVPTFGEQDDALKTVPVTPLPTNATSLFPCDASYSQPIYSRNADDMAWVTNDLVTRPNCSAQLLISGNAYGMSPDKQDNWFEFSQAIAACRRSNVPCRVVVERGGTYKFSQERAVNFENLTDFTLDLKPPAGQPKVTLAFVRLARISHLLHVNNCTRCEFRNFDVDWQWDRWPLASLVRMAGIRNDGLELDLEFFQYAKSNSSSGGARRSRFEIRQQQVTAQPFDPKKIAGYRSLHLVDQTNYNMAIRDGTEYFSINSQFDTITPQPNSNVITLKLKSALTPALQQGSIYLIRHFVYTGHAFTVALCQHCTFTEINIWSAPGKGMTMKDDCEHLAFTKMRITRPDTPFAATGQPRPISVTADGIFFEKTRGKIIISDVEVGWNGDDCVNNHDSIWGNYGITRTGSNSLLIPAKIVQGPDVIGGSSDGGSGGSVSVPLPNDSNWPPQNTDPDFMVGDKIQLRKGDLSAWLSTTVTSAKNGKTGWELGTADALPDADLTSSVLVNERRSGGKFLVRGMTCHDNRARGILCGYFVSKVVLVVDRAFYLTFAQPRSCPQCKSETRWWSTRPSATLPNLEL